jgi:hypothetical protein
MVSGNTNKRATGVPEGYLAVPASTEQNTALLRLCVLVKQTPDPVAGHFVSLRTMLDAQVLLGCITDAAGRVQSWIELWIQQTGQIASSPLAQREALSNALLDERWRKNAEALDALDRRSVIKTGWEAAHPPPAFLDLKQGRCVLLSDKASGDRWSLCQDDALLGRKGLPPFSTSLHRYLYLKAAGDEARFIPVTAGAPTNTSTRKLSDLVGESLGLVALNPGGGYMMARAYSPMGLAEFADVLAGEQWSGVKQGRALLDPEGIADALSHLDGSQGNDGRLLRDTPGRGGRLVETLHLKLRLLADASAAVSEMVRQTQRPMLNVTPESFRIRFGEPGRGLPFLWTAKAVLAEPGDAVALPLPGQTVQYYAYGRETDFGLYRPPVYGHSRRGRGSVRIPKIVTESDGQTSLDVTLVTQEDILPQRSDLVCFRLNLGGGVVELYARLDTAAAGGGGEWRFHGSGQTLSPETLASLRAAEGVEMGNTAFEIIPLLGSACDLYALGVLAVRLLLVDGQSTLPQAMDKVRSLGAQAAQPDASAPLAKRIAAVFATDKRWAQWLGPHHALREAMEPEAALAMTPPELWWDVLAVIIRMFPGNEREAACRDYGDAPAGALHKVFGRAIEDLSSLILRTRSLIVVDWRLNREIEAIIRKHMPTLARGSAGPVAASIK